MRKIILTVGAPASGKSTWAKEQVRKSNGKIKRLNLDELRETFGVLKFDYNEEKHIQQVMYDIGLKFLRKGYDIIADNTNLSNKSWLGWCDIARQVGDCTVEEKNFDVSLSLKELLARNSLRDRKVPDGVIEKMYNKWINKKANDPAYFPPVSLKESSDKYESKKSLPECYIVDLDGTLAIHKDRSIYDFMRCDEDDVNIPLKELLNSTSSDVKIIILSGRTDDCLEKTKDWLGYHEIRYDKIYLKPKNRESEKDTAFKEWAYKNYISQKYRVKAVFDDRDKVVALWRSLNLPTYQVNYGDF